MDKSVLVLWETFLNAKIYFLLYLGASVAGQALSACGTMKS